MEFIQDLITGVTVNVITYYIYKWFNAREEEEKIGNEPKD